jgi:hypothetical protein
VDLIASGRVVPTRPSKGADDLRARPALDCARCEAARLTWRDFDLERGLVVLDENKTDDLRSWALSPWGWRRRCVVAGGAGAKGGRGRTSARMLDGHSVSVGGEDGGGVGGRGVEADG